MNAVSIDRTAEWDIRLGQYAEADRNAYSRLERTERFLRGIRYQAELKALIGKPLFVPTYEYLETMDGRDSPAWADEG